MLQLFERLVQRNQLIVGYVDCDFNLVQVQPSSVTTALESLLISSSIK
jgi:hypothetical protein